MAFIFVYITNPDKKTAKRICLHLLSQKLIACGNIYQSNSIYRWKGKLVDETEYVLVAKTISRNYEKVKKEVKRIHPYEIPCIAKMDVESNNDFFNWLKKQVN